MGNFNSQQSNKEYDKIINELRSESREQKKQIESLININDFLEKQKSFLKEKFIKEEATSQKVKLSNLSEHKIDEFVEEILKNKDINIGYFPDYVEKRIYKNVFTILINLLDNIVETTSVQLLGHEIKFDFSPQKTQTTENSKEE
jgi:GTPase involved in cell partitioning and DNA repair